MVGLPHLTCAVFILGVAELWSLRYKPTTEQIESHDKLFMYGFDQTPVGPRHPVKKVLWFGCGVMGDYLKAIPADKSALIRVPIE